MVTNIKPNIPIFKIEKYGYLSDFYIKKKYQNRGIGSMFFK